MAVVLTVPLALIAMVSALQFGGWRWAALGLAAPVVLWSASGFHRAAVVNARHGAATMDTLVSLGTLAAFVWSVVVLVAGITAHTYFEVGAVITTLILLGRYFRGARPPDLWGGDPGVLELGAKQARVIRDGEEMLVPVDRLMVGDVFVVVPVRRSPRTGLCRRARRRSTSRC